LVIVIDRENCRTECLFLHRNSSERHSHILKLSGSGLCFPVPSPKPENPVPELKVYYQTHWKYQAMADSTKWPPFAPVPPSGIRENLPPEEWEACIDSWIILAHFRLTKWTGPGSESDFVAHDTSIVPFLTSYHEALFLAGAHDALKTSPKALDLRKVCFALSHRLLSLKDPPDPLLDWAFLGNLCANYGQSTTLKSLEDLWSRRSNQIMQGLEKAKNFLAKILPLGKISSAHLARKLNQLTCLSLVLPEAGHVLMTGSDYLDSLYATYRQGDGPFRNALTANAYMGLTSLMKTSQPNISLLLDHLFSLKSTADQDTKASPKGVTLLADLVANTSFLSHLSSVLQTSNHTRGAKLLDSLQDLKSRTPSSRHPYKRRKHRPGKGKSRAPALESTPVSAHTLSLIIQIQDLFPNLGEGYISHLLTFYSNNSETVIAHLLDNSLDPSLSHLDPSTPLPSTPHRLNLSPRPTPPLDPLPERRNIFDNDPLSNLQISASQLHIGKARADYDADNLLSAPPSNAKSAILSALAAFDSDDDERDDTYDVADVGGTVDSVPQDSEADLRDRKSAAAAGAGEEEAAEGVLFAAFKANLGVFARNSQTRRSKGREELRKQLLEKGVSMTDEAIEGFAVMLQRDPKRLKRLETRYSATGIGVQQTTLLPTAYRKPAGETDTEEDTGGEGPAGARGRGGFRGRGRGRGGRGGNAGGPAGEKDTERARQRKETRGNQRRREGRARKMARAGFPG
jgi:activating signal cointegrator complex subunit 2